ncbi:unannotated protein [freshwater metagenome]|uniref:Unannotated protein n=1 Tax=freshwater metagenome TaxID=449393 RepID=A0A6J7U6F3_9ZZZZ
MLYRSIKPGSTEITWPLVPALPSSVVTVIELTARLPSKGAYIFPAEEAPRTISTRQPFSFNNSANPKSGADPYPPPTNSAFTGSVGMPKLVPSGPTISTVACIGSAVNQRLP